MRLFKRGESVAYNRAWAGTVLPAALQEGHLVPENRLSKMGASSSYEPPLGDQKTSRNRLASCRTSTLVAWAFNWYPSLARNLAEP